MPLPCVQHWLFYGTWNAPRNKLYPPTLHERRTLAINADPLLSTTNKNGVTMHRMHSSHKLPRHIVTSFSACTTSTPFYTNMIST
mmetsp:Transcript_5113/g.7800  ORF Transcript_5113/g.7800 Transcript_5113/m.7800 type:complete len:85 (+) Transcript_5113:164-418(+)